MNWCSVSHIINIKHK